MKLIEMNIDKIIALCKKYKVAKLVTTQVCYLIDYSRLVGTHGSI